MSKRLTVEQMISLSEKRGNNPLSARGVRYVLLERYGRNLQSQVHKLLVGEDIATRLLPPRYVELYVREKDVSSITRILAESTEVTSLGYICLPPGYGVTFLAGERG